MREHARIAHRNLERAFSNQRILDLVPGSALIKRRIRA
jgi:GntR family transcriptional regulator of vanillate catabolism